MYDFYLGGSHNFAVDRQAAQAAMKALPDMPLIAQANRAFLRRVVRHLVKLGVTQFIDIGSGIPTVGNVHETAANPSARVVYVEIDPITVAHGRALLDGNDLATIIQADLRRPDQVLSHPELLRVIDLDEPVALLMMAVLHFLPDADDPHATVVKYYDAVVPGSYLAISHASHVSQPERSAGLGEVYARTPSPLTFRDRDEVTRFFDGWQLIEPGVQRMTRWRPDPQDDASEEWARRIGGFGGVGLKT